MVYTSEDQVTAEKIEVLRGLEPNTRPGDPTPSIYALNAAKMLELGFSPIPIAGGQKFPASSKWQLHCRDAPSSEEISRYSQIPNACIGIALGFLAGSHQIIAMDIDVDGDDLDKLASALPYSPMEKRGAKGLTRYYRADPSMRPKHYRSIEGRGLADLQAHGTQTVIPPSHHPSGMDYTWTAGPVAAIDLPIFDQDDRYRFEDALSDLGWEEPCAVAEPIEAAELELKEDDEDPVWLVNRQLNERALSNLSWVLDLGLYNCRATPGGYAAVATWRASASGNPPEKRKRSLSISHRGIIDFGSGKGYTPIDLVMAAFECDQNIAFVWLSEKTGSSAEIDSCFDTDAILANAARRQVRAAASEVVGPASGHVWERHGEASPFPEPFWLIKGLVPTQGTFLLAGVSTAGKTFVAISLAVALATGASFMGLPIRQRCGSMFVIGEGRSTIRKRLTAAVRGAQIQNENEKLPISFTEASLTPNRRLATIASLKAEKARMKVMLGIDLGVVFVDTLAACFEFEDENSSAEATKSMKVLNDIGRELGCLVIATAHHGKNEATGVRGSSAFTASADDILTVLIEKDGSDNVVQRQVRVAKTRDGEIGKRFPFELVSTSVGTDQDGDDIVSAFVRAMDEAVIVRTSAPLQDRLSQAAKAYAAALAVMQSEAVNVMPFGVDGSNIKAVPRELVRREFYASYPADGDTEAKRQETKRKAFNKGEATLIAKSKIVTRDVGPIAYVWMTTTPPTFH